MLNREGISLKLLPDWDDFVYKQEWQNEIGEEHSRKLYSDVLAYLSGLENWLKERGCISQESSENHELHNKKIDLANTRIINRTYIAHKAAYRIYQGIMMYYVYELNRNSERIPTLLDLLDEINDALGTKYHIRTLQTIVKKGKSGYFDE